MTSACIAPATIYSPCAFSLPFCIKTIHTSFTICIPDEKMVQTTAFVAREIFVEAFSTTYSEYHRISGSTETLEAWLGLKEGLTVEHWLQNTFDWETEAFQKGEKRFIYLVDSDAKLVGWLSHDPPTPEGDLYLSQCALSADWRNQRVASTAFYKMVSEGHLKTLFPGVKAVKLIARKINAVARQLYTHAGFTLDEAIDPHVYGESYSDRYVGYRLKI